MATFRARARALDMLGRQQIAGVPSAVNELFKNAYDAYATKVEAHFIRPANVLIIRDNGVGMTLHDFLNKWLILGTESKFGAEGDEQRIFRPAEMQKRPIAGEKGIGRLAIGILGNQVFVWTKAVRKDGAHSPVVAFVNWAAFAVPDVDLGDIQIPVRELEADCYPDEALLRGLVTEFRDGFVRACADRATQGMEEDVLDDLDHEIGDLAEWLQELETDDFNPGVNGTTFIMSPASAALRDALQSSSAGPSDSPIVKELAGFSNTMSPAEARPVAAAFWVHDGPGEAEDVLSESGFWSDQDFAHCDHEILGNVDEFGAFRGKIRIFQGAGMDHVVPYKAGAGHRTDCGPFEVYLGIIQGAQRESSLDPEMYGHMRSRLERFAGVYIYRDGLRVLPYGRAEYDWLRIEERRTRQAAYYFFSHRRMFGYVGVSRARNGGLREKAGREGFQENRAYKQMREILEQLLMQLAADFFRGEEGGATPFRMGIKANDRQHRASARLAATKKKRLKDFRKAIEDVESLLDGNSLELHVSDVVRSVKQRAGDVPSASSPDEIVRTLISLESEASAELGALWRRLDFSRPRGVAVGKNLDRAYDLVADRKAQAEREVFSVARQEVHDVLKAVAREAGTAINERLRATTLIEQSNTAALRQTRRQASAARAAAQAVSDDVARIAEAVSTDLDQQLRAILLRSNGFDFDRSTAEESEAFISSSLHEIDLTAEFFSGAMSALTDSLSSLDFEWDAETGLTSSLDQRQALDQELEDLRDQADTELELAQLGLSVDIINHEFLGSINAIQKGLKSLDSWVAINPDMQSLGQILNTNFTHLENFLGLFSPLRRRFNAERTTIVGTEIVDYLRSIFIERLRTSAVELEISESFRSRKVFSYASVILPVFTNLVDNALFWLQDQPSPRKIELTVDGGSWLVSDNGPGIPPRYKDAVFSPGFTTKPGGRGIGLYVAKQVLERNGFTIAIEEMPRLGRGTTFRIDQRKEEAGSV